jgi:predicted transcriptional regulator of viral defense system
MGMHELRQLATTQRSLMTRDQARHELTEKQLRGAVARRELEVVHHGVLRVTGHPGDRRQQLLAAVLAGQRHGAVLGFLSGAELVGLLAPFATWPEILVARRGLQQIDGITIHTTDRLPPSHVTVVDGIPVTTVARTVFDSRRTPHARPHRRRRPPPAGHDAGEPVARP